MRIYSDDGLRNFDFWAGARTNAEELTYDQLNDLEAILEDMYPDGMSAVELNDLMWFEFDTIKEWLGIEDEDEDEDEDFEESLRRHRMSSMKRRNESLRRANRKSNRRR